MFVILTCTLIIHVNAALAAAAEQDAADKKLREVFFNLIYNK